MSDESWRLVLLPVLFHAKMELSFTQIWNRHFDRSCSQSHREQRSGEIRFSAEFQPAENPHFAFAVAVACPRRCLFLLSSWAKRRIPQNSTNPNHPYLSTHALVRVLPSLFFVQNSKTFVMLREVAHGIS